jgi:hypothetical protein
MLTADDKKKNSRREEVSVDLHSPVEITFL